MAIECYHSGCKYHATQTDLREGPYCYQQDCLASKVELESFKVIRHSVMFGYHVCLTAPPVPQLITSK
jgi:hypothetical protein